MSLVTDIVGSVVLFLSSTLASAAGIGGGGLNVPILIVIFQFGFSKAAVLSLWTVLGNITAQFFLNYNSRHPEKMSRPLIYWDVVVVLLPAQLGGASIGVLLSDVCPKTVLVLLALIILCFANAKTFFKGLDKWKKETIHLKAESALEAPLMDASNHTEKTEDIDILIQQELDERVSEIIHHTPLEVPWDEIKALCVLWIINAALLIGMNQYGDCSLEKYLFLGATYPVLLVFCIGGFKYVSDYQEKHPKSVLPSDLVWADVGPLPPPPLLTPSLPPRSPTILLWPHSSWGSSVLSSGSEEASSWDPSCSRWEFSPRWSPLSPHPASPPSPTSRSPPPILPS
jgi:hypothetical protein